MASTFQVDKIDAEMLQHSTLSKTEEEGCAASSSIILVVTRNAHLAEPVMEYTINLAERLHCRLLAVYVNTLPFLIDGSHRNRQFSSALLQSASVYRRKASVKGVVFDYVQESGKVSKVINRLCHIAKRIEFVVIDKGIKLEEAVARASVPVFNIFYESFHQSEKEPWHHRKIFLQRISKR